MRAQEFTIIESRRNPDKNPRAPGHQAALKFLKSIEARMWLTGRPEFNTYNYGVSMTNLPKLGVNPGSQYNTPVGIYFYPAEYYMKLKEQNKELDFQDSAPYIQILKIQGNFEEISDMTESVFYAYIKKLHAQAGKIGTLIGLSEKQTQDLLSRIVARSSSEAMVDTHGGHFWNVLYSLGFYAGRGKRSGAPPRSSVVWNAILRLVGIDGLIDRGEGIIHPNEPTSGVAIDPRSVQLVRTFTNTSNPDLEQLNASRASLLSYWSQYLKTMNDVQHIIAGGTKEFHYREQYKKECALLVDKIRAVLAANPKDYVRLDPREVKNLGALTPDAGIRKDLMLDYYTLRFHQVQAWAAMLLPGAKKAAEKLVAELALYQSDARARAMIKRIKNFQISDPQPQKSQLP